MLMPTPCSGDFKLRRENRHTSAYVITNQYKNICPIQLTVRTTILQEIIYEYTVYTQSIEYTRPKFGQGSRVNKYL